VEREKSGLLRTFDPQTGEQNILAKYFKAASRDYGINVLRVDNLDFNIGVVSKVITEQSTPRFKGVSDANAAKGGVLALPTKNTKLRQYKDDLAKQIQTQRIESTALRTGHFYQTKSSFKRGIYHAINKESPLGEIKDMTSPKDIANINKKRKRGVTSYNAYEWKYRGNTWVLKTEVYKNERDTIYNIYKKNKPIPRAVSTNDLCGKDLFQPSQK